MEIKHCPSCAATGKDIEVKGNTVACVKCDAIYKINADGAKVEQTGVIDDLKKRLDALEAKKPSGDDPAAFDAEVEEEDEF